MSLLCCIARYRFLAGSRNRKIHSILRQEQDAGNTRVDSNVSRTFFLSNVDSG